MYTHYNEIEYPRSEYLCSDVVIFYLFVNPVKHGTNRAENRGYSWWVSRYLAGLMSL